MSVMEGRVKLRSFENIVKYGRPKPSSFSVIIYCINKPLVGHLHVSTLPWLFL